MYFSCTVTVNKYVLAQYKNPLFLMSAQIKFYNSNKIILGCSYDICMVNVIA